MRRVTVGKEVLGAILNHKIDVPKPKEFTRTRFISNVDNFLRGIEQYFRVKGIIDDATKVNIIALYFSDVALLWWHHKSTSENVVEPKLGLGRSFKMNSRHIFTLNMPRSRLKQSCVNLRNEAQLGSMYERSTNSYSKFFYLRENVFFSFIDGLKP